MKALKIVGIVILFLVAIVLIVPLFMAEQVLVTSSIDVEAKPAKVFKQVNNFKNWAHWSPFEKDSTIVNTYEGPSSGVGTIRHWTGETAGSGTMTLLESTPFTFIKNKLDFGPDGGGIGEWIFTETEDGCSVSWNITVSELSYPFGKLFSPLIGTMLTPMLNSGLKALKTHVETDATMPDISIIDTDLITTLAIYDSTKIAGIGDLLESNYGSLMQYIHKSGDAISGAPIAVYHNWDPEGYIRISAAIPIHGKAKGKGNIEGFNIEAGRAVYLQHFGGYNTAASHYIIDDFIKEHNLSTKDFIWEAYITDPETEPDSTKWQTDIYYPLK